MIVSHQQCEVLADHSRGQAHMHLGSQSRLMMVLSRLYIDTRHDNALSQVIVMSIMQFGFDM